MVGALEESGVLTSTGKFVSKTVPFSAIQSCQTIESERRKKIYAVMPPLTEMSSRGVPASVYIAGIL